jgi:4-hydroxy-tetrahydrodipicolinate synthase
MPISLATLVERIRGVFPAVVTPLTEDEEFDATAFERLVEYLLSNGVHGLWVLGGGGEGPNFSKELRGEVIRTAVQLAAGRVPVLIGTGAPSTRQTIENSQQAVNLGADAVAVIAPYFYLLKPDELQSHFETVAREAGVPVMLYHNPYNTKMPMSLEMIEALSTQEGIIGIKDSGGDFGFTQALLRLSQFRPGFRIFQGIETSAAATILLGGHGAVLGMANLAPRLCVQLYEAATQRDITRTLALQARLDALLGALWGGTNSGDGLFIGGVKVGLSLLGICCPRSARPFLPIADDEIAALREAMEREGLLS